jgi:hypothetical protein
MTSRSNSLVIPILLIGENRMPTIENEILLGRIANEAINGQVQIKALLELLIDKGIITQEEYDEKYTKVYSEITENHSAKVLGISVEEFRELVK